jgi:hypothetical protein
MFVLRLIDGDDDRHVVDIQGVPGCVQGDVAST